MNRDKLLNLICDVHPCVDFNLFFNNWLDKYDKHVIEQYKADTELKDTIREIHDNVAREIYCKGVDDFVEKVELKYLGVNPDELYEKYYPREICEQIKKIAEQLKAGVKNE